MEKRPLWNQGGSPGTMRHETEIYKYSEFSTTVIVTGALARNTKKEFLNDACDFAKDELSFTK